MLVLQGEGRGEDFTVERGSEHSGKGERRGLQ